MMRLSFATLDKLPASVARPSFDPRVLRSGIVHLGVGNFHRAHQAVFTEDAVARTGGDWGIIGVSLRHPDISRELAQQDNLYTVETLSEPRGYRVMGILRRMLWAGDAGSQIISSLASPNIRIVTLTVTEKGYCLKDGELDFAHPDIRHDVTDAAAPRSAIGWLARGLSARKAAGGDGLTIISCDNLAGNGVKLAKAVRSFIAAAAEPGLATWLDDHVRFPGTMVDCMVPAGDEGLARRIQDETGLVDMAPVMREPFAQWVIENSFAGPRPGWDAAGAEIVADAAPFERLKLHVLNLSHSALAYLGIARGHRFVRQAIGDATLLRFVDRLIGDEVAPALPDLAVATYWRRVRVRFANPNLDHRLDQIAQDGSLKLAERNFPLLIGNARAGRPTGCLAAIIRGWLDYARTTDASDPRADVLQRWARSGGTVASALDEPSLFPEPFRSDTRVRNALLEA